VQAPEEAGHQSKKKKQKSVVKRIAQRQQRKSDCNRTRKRVNQDRRHNLAYIGRNMIIKWLVVGLTRL
jgi:hypothetical protein